MSRRRLRRLRAHQGGFTLVEISVAVVIIGILSAIAAVGYTRYRNSSRMAEATRVVGMIKAEQENFKGERGLYASVSTSVTSFYPAPSPGKFATVWGGPCTNCKEGAGGWEKLPIKPDAPVMYGYATVAGVGDDVSIVESLLPPTSDNKCAAIAPTDPYFVINARGDVDGDGTTTTVTAISCTNTLIVSNEGD